MIPPILRSKGGLADVPQDTLRENLRPIVQALRKLDAKQLLSLQPSHVGPQLCEGYVIMDPSLVTKNPTGATNPISSAFLIQPLL